MKHPDPKPRNPTPGSLRLRALRPRGLKSRVLLSLVTVTVFAVTSFYLVALRAVRSRDLHVELLELQTDAASVSSRLTATGGQWGSVESLETDADHSIGLYDITGNLVAGSGPPTADPLVIEAQAHQVASGRAPGELVAAEAIGRGNDVRGVVRVTEAASLANAKTNRVLAFLALFAVGLVGASAAIGWMLMRAVTSRFEQIHRAAVGIGDGDFAMTVPPTGLAEFDRVGTALNHTAQRLGSMVERERAFAAAASHQLRTPIASFRVALEAELIAPHENPTTIVHQGLDALDRLDGTVTTLLDLARDAPRDRGVLDMPGIVHALVSRWRQPAHLCRRRIGCTAPEPHLAEIHASAAAINHVLDVLVENALLHGRGDVVVAGAVVEGGYALRVGDQGSIASSSEDLFRKREFDASTTGRGIGLSLARTLAAAEGAHLRLVRDHPTTFELLFADSRSAGPTEPQR